MHAFANHSPASTQAFPQSHALDCETASLLRSFLLPIFEKATAWENLREGLMAKGYEPAFRDGHLVLCNLDTPQILRLSSLLSAPLHSRIERLGHAHPTAHRGGAINLLV